MLQYNQFLNRDFVHGRQDCWTLIRDFYLENFNLTLRNYARPDEWWDNGDNLYMDLFRDEGFHVFNGPPQEWKAGDVVLMAVRSSIANHAGVFVENGMILHQLWNRRPIAEAYRGLTRNSTVAVLRHRDVKYETPVSSIEVLDVLPPAVRRKYLDLISKQREGAGGADPQVG